MLDDRKAAVLRAVVEEYISTAVPVGSGHLAGRPGMAVSSATVRSELAHLEREPGEIPSILSVTRTILVETRPVAYLWDIVPTEYLHREELAHGFHGSVLDILLRRSSPVLGYSLTELTAISANADLARQLHVPPKSPLMQLQAKLCTPENRVVDFSISYFVPDSFNFHVIRRIGR